MNENGRGTAVLDAEALRRDFVSGEETLEVLRGVDLRIEAGAFLAVVGPSGSGKSTLLHCLGGLDRPTAGSVRLRETDLATLGDGALARLRNREVGFVFQFHHLFPDFTARENVMLPRLIAGESRVEAEERARRLLTEVGLGGRLDHAPGELSGGEQQRVAVARALVNEPSVVLADEPSGNLDLASSRALHDLLAELRERSGVAILIATHDPVLARRADRVLAMREGRLEAVTSDDPMEWVTSPGEGIA
jgi:lipoprotein-releasing system ATP-binding protein